VVACLPDGTLSGGARPVTGARSAGTASPTPVPGRTIHDSANPNASLVIPALGVDAPLVATGAVGPPETASLTIPDDVSDVGWWDGTVTDGDRRVQEQAPAPGQPGVAILAGHVDSAAAGPGALYHLGDLSAGDTVQITGNRSTTTWRVTGPAEVTDKATLPSTLFATTGPPLLALVTCGGPFDSATGHYEDNIIVWAAPVSHHLTDASRPEQ
jgi:hypothetical protein